MKSRTSFFNATVFKKNLTRFAPAWGLYTVILVLAVITNLYEDDRAGSWLLDLAKIEIPFLFCYAHVCTQLLFGDLLYNTRMCNALHAMPLKRETWFVTNIASGFAFFLIPTLAASVLAWLLMAGSGYPGSMAVVPLFLLTALLQFTCFFGISTFASFFAGNRFAHAVVYGLLNFGSMILYGLVETLYVSMYYGVGINQDAFLRFSPMDRMSEGHFLRVVTITITELNGAIRTVDTAVIQRGDNFTYYFIVAAVGLALILASLWLYRRRKLECAGDFLAIRAMEPVFSVVYTLSVGAFFHLISAGMYLIAGLIVGWFTGRMLLERTVRVFRKKNILRGTAVIGIFLLSLAIAYFDPLGIEAWVPVNRVESVTLTEGGRYYQYDSVTLDEPWEIERVYELHQSALDEHFQGYPHEMTYEDAKKELIEQTVVPDEMDRYGNHIITYHLTDGRTVNRYYRIWMGDEDGQFLKSVFSTPEAVFGYEEDPDRFLAENSKLRIRDTWQNWNWEVRYQTDIEGLYRAILADCREQTMAQRWWYHGDGTDVCRITLEDGREVIIYADAEHTLNWLRDFGINVEQIIDEKKK